MRANSLSNRVSGHQLCVLRFKTLRERWSEKNNLRHERKKIFLFLFLERNLKNNFEIKEEFLRVFLSFSLKLRVKHSDFGKRKKKKKKISEFRVGDDFDFFSFP